MQPCGATSLAHRGFLLGAYAAWDSSSSGPGQTSECEPGEASRRLGSSDRLANSCCISSDDKPSAQVEVAGEPAAVAAVRETSFGM